MGNLNPKVLRPALESHSGSSRDITEGNGDRIDILRLLLPWIKSSDGVVARAQKKGVMGHITKSPDWVSAIIHPRLDDWHFSISPIVTK